ncbi:MAG: GIY-YIG nuclease family protein [Selenomonadaceae bacterium]|nr:GIY-YIG nuclease family protein [Selenomonadaceae bacterium]
MEVYGVVYLIWNMVNGKRYVGQTIQTLEDRFNQHARSDSFIGKAIRKYGRENFRYGVIKTCASKEELDECERYFIAALKSKAPYGYNLTDGGEKSSGTHHTPEHCAKISAALKGREKSPEHCAKLAKSKIGKPLPIETIEKMLAAQSGEKNHNYSKPLASETCSKISVANRGNSVFKNLLREIDAHQLSYRRLAKLMGLSYPSISAKMLGKLRFTERDKVKLVDIFGKPIDYLLERAENTNCENVPAPNRKSPYKNLLAELDARNLSYRHLAKLMGLAHSNIARKMRDERNFTERDKVKFVEIFGKPIEYFLARDDG